MKLLIITNIPTPYRIAFFNVLQNYLKMQNGCLKVFYCTENEPDRHWKINLSEQQFDYEILSGYHASIGGLYLHFNPSVLKKTKAFKPDIIVYAGSWNMPTVMLSVLFNTLFKKKYLKVFWSEGHDGSRLHASGIVPVIRNFIQNKFDAFAVPNLRSESYLFDLLGLKRKPIVLLPNTVDGVFYTKPTLWSAQDSDLIKSKYDIPKEAKLLIQVAQIEDRKGVVELVAHWNKLKNKFGYHLVFVGEGSLKDKLIAENEHDKTIHFLGNRTKEEVRELLFSSTLFILYTKNDPNPLTLIEASYAKLPIITTQFAGNCNEIIVDNNGVILDNLEFNIFEEAFEKIIDNMSTEIGNKSFENVKHKFDIQMVVKSLVEQLKKI